MLFSFDYRPYCLPFKEPLWIGKQRLSQRNVIYLKVKVSGGQASFAEIAPLPTHGSESVEESLEFCKKYALQEISLGNVSAPLQSLPATKFALEVALWNLQDPPSQTESLFPSAALLFADKDVAMDLEHFLKKGFSTFKLKIGMCPLAYEIDVIDFVLSSMGPKGVLRLDANGRLSLDAARRYLKALEGKAVSFLEQPMAVGQEEQMIALCEDYSTPIAWDESLATTEDVLRAMDRGFKGPCVIKPPLLGDLTGFLNWRRSYPKARVIYSGSFESSLGIDTMLRLASQETSLEALGLGTLNYFKENTQLFWHTFSPEVVYSPQMTYNRCNDLWN